MPSSHGNREGASLSDFLQILRLRRALIGLILCLVLAVTLAVTALLPRWYLATTKVRVEKPEGTVQLYQAQASAAYDPSFLLDQFKIMQSEKILYPVIEHLGLDSRLAASLGISGTALPTDITYHYLVDKMLQIESQRNSSLIEISVYSQDPGLGAAIANEIAKVYSEDRISLATSEQREGLAQLRKELTAQEDVVSHERDLVEKVRKDLNISGVDINVRYSDMEIERLRQMQNSLIALRVDAIGRKTRWERFKEIPFEQRLTLVNSELIPDTNIQNLLQGYLIADQKVSQLRSRLGEAHPDLVSAIANRAKMLEQLESLLTGYEQSLGIAYNEAEARVEELESQLAKAKVDQILSARERMRPFEEAAQKLEDETRLLTTLKLTLRQREIDFQVPKRTIEILNTAEPARRPSRPNWVLNIACAFVFGGALGVGLAVALEYFDTSLRSVSDIETRLQTPVLGVIPFRPDPAALNDTSPEESEPFRVLQTNLDLALKPSKAVCLAMVSAGPEEGKSTTLFRLSRVMGSVGDRVILIDADLRRPAQHRLAQRPREPGLSDVLSGRCTLESAIQPGIAPGLDFLPSGGVSGFTLSLLFAQRLKELLPTLRGRYDKIIFDSPPIIGVSDASVLVSLLDGVMLLIQYRRNPATMVARAHQILLGLKTPLLGAVINQVPPNSGEDYGYYTEAYSYYAGGGRGGRKKSSKGGGESGGDGAGGGGGSGDDGDRLILK